MVFKNFFFSGSPWNQANNPTVQTEAELEIQCIINITDFLEAALQEKVAKDRVFLDPKRVFFHHLSKSSKLPE